MDGERAELFILGANGFIGKEVVKEALRRGCRVKALVREVAKAAELAESGARLIEGDAARPAEWIGEAATSNVMIDLVQPALPNRIGLQAIRKIAERRVAIARRLVAALDSLPAAGRPLLMAVSGLDDLAPDSSGRVFDDSPLRTEPHGFAHIGIPVRRVLEQADAACTFAYLGTVYGPGKAFARRVFPQIAAGRFRMAGDGRNRMPIVHVEDAARALVHLALLPAARLAGRSFVIADGSNATMSQFAGFTAELLGAPVPPTVPVWLARLPLGTVLCETLTRDIAADPRALLAEGFEFRYPSYAEGVPAALNRLGYDVPRARKNRFPVGLLVAALSALLTENLLDFPLSVPRLKLLAGGLPILDMRPYYSTPEVYRLFDALGAAGRTAYLHLLWSIDLCLPALFALFLSAVIQRGRFRRFAWVAMFAAAADYAENIAITILLLRYPHRAPAVALISSALTSLKHAGYLSSVLLGMAGYLSSAEGPYIPGMAIPLRRR